MAVWDRLREIETAMSARLNDTLQHLQAAEKAAADAKQVAESLAADVRDLQERTEALELLGLQLLGQPCSAVGDGDDLLCSPAVDAPSDREDRSRSPVAQRQQGQRRPTPTAAPADAPSDAPTNVPVIGCRFEGRRARRRTSPSPVIGAARNAGAARRHTPPVFRIRIGDLDGMQPLQRVQEMVECFLEPWWPRVLRVQAAAGRASSGDASAIVEFSDGDAAWQAHDAAKHHWQKQSDGTHRRWHAKWLTTRS